MGTLHFNFNIKLLLNLFLLIRKQILLNIFVQFTFVNTKPNISTYLQSVINSKQLRCRVSYEIHCIFYFMTGNALLINMVWFLWSFHPLVILSQMQLTCKNKGVSKNYFIKDWHTKIYLLKKNYRFKEEVNIYIVKVLNCFLIFWQKYLFFLSNDFLECTWKTNNLIKKIIINLTNQWRIKATEL